jgi:hypothetical protein
MTLVESSCKGKERGGEEGVSGVWAWAHVNGRAEREQGERMLGHESKRRAYFQRGLG